MKKNEEIKTLKPSRELHPPNGCFRELIHAHRSDIHLGFDPVFVPKTIQNSVEWIHQKQAGNAQKF